MAALDAPCPNCMAKPGEKCTAPTNVSRRPVGWTHLSRIDLAAATASVAAPAPIPPRKDS